MSLKIKQSEGATDSNIVISINNVSKYYKLYDAPKDRLKEALSLTGKVYHKEFYATNDVNLTIRKGEIIGIIGKNGCGKSTLLKLICGVLTPNRGSIKVNGEISALLELGSGFNPRFTGYENIYFYGSILGFSKQEMDEKIDDILDFADIGEFIHQPVKTYSSGMKARLGFSVATNIDPDILILDEVLSVGDVLFRRKSYARMQEFFESGKTVIYVSHNTNQINRLCTRAVFLLDGKIVMDGEPKIVSQFYEKYLFANKSNQSEIVNEIERFNNRNCQIDNSLNTDKKENNSIPDNIENNLVINESPVISRTIKSVLPSESSDNPKSFLISDFVSKNQIEYDNTRLDIFDICIKTENGEKVNNLVTLESYRYCYKLRFKKEFDDVGFNMQVVTEKGTLVSSSGSRMHGVQILSAKKDDVYFVEWKFDCALLSGVYYINVGAKYTDGNERKYINRITDAFVFKVLDVPNNKYSGIITLQQIPRFKKFVN